MVYSQRRKIQLFVLTKKIGLQMQSKPQMFEQQKQNHYMIRKLSSIGQLVVFQTFSGKNNRHVRFTKQSVQRFSPLQIHRH